MVVFFTINKSAKMDLALARQSGAIRSASKTKLCEQQNNFVAEVGATNRRSVVERRCRMATNSTFPLVRSR
jgi:hypothetical protein